jgi:hypothetical protein
MSSRNFPLFVIRFFKNFLFGLSFEMKLIRRDIRFLCKASWQTSPSCSLSAGREGE